MKQKILTRNAAVLLFFLSLILNSQVSFAKGIDDLQPFFYRGNDFYEKGKYDEAIAEYSRIKDAGYESGSLYYNIGNCYFKKGKLGKAIVNYERAKRLIPGDKDLQYNYNYALSLVKGDINKSEKPLSLKTIANIFSSFTINGLTALLSLLYISVLSTIIARKYIAKFKKYSIVIMTVILIFFILSLFSLVQKITMIDKTAIITSETAKARFGPIENATNHYILYEGMKVEVVQSKDSWYKLKRQDGKIGWVTKEKLEII